MRSSVYVAIPLMLALAVLQTAVLPRFPFFGFAPQLPFLFALSWTLLHGLEQGLVWGFIAGILLDLFSIGPMGATSLAYMAAILAVTGMVRLLPENRFFIPVIVAAAGSIIYLFVYLIFVRLLGQAVSMETAVRLMPLVLLNAGAMLPIYWSTYAVNRAVQPHRVEL